MIIAHVSFQNFIDFKLVLSMILNPWADTELFGGEGILQDYAQCTCAND